MDTCVVIRAEGYWSIASIPLGPGHGESVEHVSCNIIPAHVRHQVICLPFRRAFVCLP